MRSRFERAGRLRDDFQSSLIARQEQNSAEKELPTHRLAKLRPYAGSSSMPTIAAPSTSIDLAEWTGILEIALRFASNCSAVYRAANERDRHSLNSAVFERIEVTGAAISNVRYHPPFDQLLGLREFEYGSMERETGFEPATSTLARLRSTD